MPATRKEPSVPASKAKLPQKARPEAPKSEPQPPRKPLEGAPQRQSLGFVMERVRQSSSEQQGLATPPCVGALIVEDAEEELSKSSQRRKEENIKAMLGNR